MEKDFLKEFVLQISKEQQQKNAEEKRKKYFQELGRKGGLKKKTINHYSKVISIRFTEKEFEEIKAISKKYKLTHSKYLRMLLTEKELKINEFETDKTLLEYGNNFIRIRNLLRHREFSAFENKKKIMDDIEEVLKLIREYLYHKTQSQNLDNE